MSNSNNDKNNEKSINEKSINERFSVPQTSANIPMPNVKPPKDDNGKTQDKDE